MREIKFRAWDKRERHRYGENTPHMRFDVQYTYDCEAGSSFGELIDDADVILMQYTGLLDKNGNEIYEGDILRGSLGSICVIEWNSENGSWTTFLPRKDFEVIGNVFENPELIKN